MMKIIVLLIALVAPVAGTLLYAAVTGDQTVAVIMRLRAVVMPYIWVGIAYIAVVTLLLSRSIEAHQKAQERGWRA